MVALLIFQLELDDCLGRWIEQVRNHSLQLKQLHSASSVYENGVKWHSARPTESGLLPSSILFDRVLSLRIVTHVDNHENTKRFTQLSPGDLVRMHRQVQFESSTQQ